MNEIWKDIVGFEGLYQASNYGKIKSFLRRGSQINVETINYVRKLLKDGVRQYQIEKITGLSESTIYRIKHNKNDYDEKILKPTKLQSGYFLVRLNKNNKTVACLVHRLVLETFVGPCPPGMECRHLDGNPTNNKLNNLKWGTRSENQQDSVKHGTHYFHFKKGEKINVGEDNPMAKLNKEKALKIRSLKGILSQRQRATMFNVSPSAIQSIDDDRAWKNLDE